MAAIGSTQTMTVSETSNRSVLLALDQWNDVIHLPGIELPLVLSFRAGLVALFPPTALTSTSVPLAVPNISLLSGQFAHLQAGTIDSNGQQALSNGVVVRLL